jgi:hypothetical protein
MMAKKLYSEQDWRKEARQIIRAEMTRRGLGYKELAKLFEGMGISYDWKTLSNKISRGTFTAAFFLQCLDTLVVTQIQLTNKNE